MSYANIGEVYPPRAAHNPWDLAGDDEWYILSLPLPPMRLGWCPGCRNVIRMGSEWGAVVICGAAKPRPADLPKAVVWTNEMACDRSIIPWPELDAALILVGTDKEARDRTATDMIRDRQHEEYLAAQARTLTPAQAEHREVTLDALRDKFNRGRRR